MTDVLTPAQRSFNMSRIKGKDTKPEMLIRRGLHAKGLRYRLHDRKLPGRPDLVFPKYKTVVFIHGCFWHSHGCSLSKLPATRQEFWQEKLEGNKSRDQRVLNQLQAEGWRVLVIWECTLRGKQRRKETEILEFTERFICHDTIPILEISGN